MNFVVIGTDHRLQPSDPGLKALLLALAKQNWIEPLTAIAEEYHERMGVHSVAKDVADAKGLHWFNIDMTTAERFEAGILKEQVSRPRMFPEHVTYRIASDDVRENFWVKKLAESSSGTTLVICGYLHFEALITKLKNRGHEVGDKRVYLVPVPEIRNAPSTC